MVGVVLVDEVLDDGAGLEVLSTDVRVKMNVGRAYFPQGDTRVGVFDGWQATVRVELHMLLRLGLVELEELDVVGEVKRLEDHAGLPGVGSAPVAPNLDRLKRHGEC